MRESAFYVQEFLEPCFFNQGLRNVQKSAYLLNGNGCKGGNDNPLLLVGAADCYGHEADAVRGDCLGWGVV